MVIPKRGAVQPREYLALVRCYCHCTRDPSHRLKSGCARDDLAECRVEVIPK